MWQMSPLNWLMLMIYFSFILITYNMIIFTTFNYMNNSFKKYKIIKMIWKW
uniref:ATP synthase F0 subunit 8 n=1 Tax=Diaphanes citrinus TaxID=2591745 RepID=A0A5C0PYC8_9COLE|nr:ATP synthase F0 subunit 8 [Diaphanes citrinus]